MKREQKWWLCKEHGTFNNKWLAGYWIGFLAGKTESSQPAGELDP